MIGTIVTTIAVAAAILSQLALLFLTAPLQEGLERLYRRKILSVEPVPLTRWGRMTFGGMAYILSLRPQDIPSQDTRRLVDTAKALIALVFGSILIVVATFAANQS